MPRSTRRLRLTFLGLVQCFYGFRQPAFVKIDTGDIQVAVAQGLFLAQSNDLAEGFLGLAKLSLLAAGAAFDETGNAIIVPTLPQWLAGRRLRRNFAVDACHGQRKLV